ncbi:MAG: GMC family oxidoreductase [Chitinophagia bacterium]|jgi:choline dehydrogenase-like flavoprotein|nr:GMC family oxidoreductase [Chitinophagia bacterium]
MNHPSPFPNTGSPSNTYDAIVIGSGISGGWAAKELCEKGLKTLILERGQDVVHIKDYPTATKNPWDFAHRGTKTNALKNGNPIVSKCYAYNETSAHFFVKDQQHPYEQEKPFDWIRGYQVGGKSLLWARQTQRWSRYDFEGPARDGFGAWPIGYHDLEAWYTYVELFAGISGNYDQLDTLPDGSFLPAWEMNSTEKIMQSKINRKFKDRHVIQGRCAHLTVPQPIHIQQGRQACQARSLCERGCPFGGYFSSNAATLPWAQKTGNLTLKTNAVVHSIIYDDKREKATGVRVIDRLTKKVTEYFSKIIFVNASTLNTNLILLNSTSRRFPNGLGNDSGMLGKFIAFHNYRGSIFANIDGPMDQYYYGRRPTQPMMPNFRNVHHQETNFLRGYMTFFSAGRGRIQANGIGSKFKEESSELGGWHVSMMMQGETIPKKTNHVRLSDEKKDDWGIPQLITSVAYDENDEILLKDFFNTGSEMLAEAGCKDIFTYDSHQAPGLDIHEIGGCRMGKDPQNSILNEWNQMHQCKNVFVTDGSCMVSTGTQNPSLTFMAITARAANFAVDALKKGTL